MNTLLKTISIIKTHVVGILKKHCALIRKLEWQVHKDSHCGSKQQCNHSITACLCHIHMGAILHTHRTRGELHIQCNGNEEVATTFPSFYEGCTWHDLHILVTAPFCCDWKARAASVQIFTLWQQATIEIMCHNHTIIACSCHIFGCYSLHTLRLWWIAH